MITDILKINSSLLALKTLGIQNNSLFLKYSKTAVLLINFLKTENLIYNVYFCKNTNKIYYNFILNLDNKTTLLKKIILISKPSRKIYLNSVLVKHIYNKNKFKTVLSNSISNLLTVNESKKLNIGGKMLFYYVLN